MERGLVINGNCPHRVVVRREEGPAQEAVSAAVTRTVLIGTEGERTGCPVSVFLGTDSDQGPWGSRELGHYGRAPGPWEKESSTHGHSKEARAGGRGPCLDWSRESAHSPSEH